MADPTFSAVGTVLEETAATHELSAPGGLSDGQLMVAIGATIGATVTALSMDESGWTLLDSFEVTTGTDQGLGVWGKFASSESGTYTVSHTNSLQFKGAILTYDNVDSAILDATATSNEGVENNSSHTPASITVANAGALNISIIVKGGGTAGGTDPTGYTERVNTGSGGPFLGVSDNAGLSTGSHQPGNWTDLGSAGDHSSSNILLKPSAGGAPVTIFEIYRRHLLGGGY